MNITIRLFAAYREAVGARLVLLELTEGATLGEAWAALAAAHPALGRFTAILGAVNAEVAPLDTPLRDGDEVAFLPPVAGGDQIGLVEGPIDEGALRRAVADPGAGAIVTFLGVTRDQTGDRRVEYLEYEAYAEMAERGMAALVAEMRARWPGLRGVALVHRVGRVEIGEASIGIAVSTPHRADAFAACRYAIDRAKERLPIWKKEVWEGGEVWIEEGPGAWEEA